MSKMKIGLIIPTLLIFTLLAALAAGCGKQPESTPGPNAKKPQTSTPEQKKPDSEQKAPLSVTLYFADQQAMYLVPEERQVLVDKDKIEEAVIKELIKGPQNPKLRKTIPEGTNLLSVSVQDGVAYVNFSKEFQTKHPGGTAGESVTIYSVVNSLCKLQGIEQVQFLLVGQKQESILGHADTSRPIGPNWDIVAK